MQCEYRQTPDLLLSDSHFKQAHRGPCRRQDVLLAPKMCCEKEVVLEVLP